MVVVAWALSGATTCLVPCMGFCGFACVAPHAHFYLFFIRACTSIGLRLTLSTSSALWTARQGHDAVRGARGARGGTADGEEEDKRVGEVGLARLRRRRGILDFDIILDLDIVLDPPTPARAFLSSFPRCHTRRAM